MHQKQNKIICNECSHVHCIQSIQTSFKDIDRVNLSQKYKYKKKVHFRDTVNQYQGKQNKKIEIELVKSWVSFTDKYGFNTPHEHSGNNVVAVYYLKTFNKCGDLLLHDPRGMTNFLPSYEINTQNYLVNERSY